MKTSKVITGFQLETLYRIMLHRIAKGYSAGQLAFLIGAPPRYVEEVEAFNRPFYTSDDLERIALALKESSVQNFFPSVDDNNELNISVHKQNHNGKWIHTICSIDQQNEEEELFRLREDEDPNLDDLPEGDDVLAMIEDTIDVLLRSGYFYEAKLPLEVFHSINDLLPNHTSPFYI
jgi:transcriptional regulator with XRE-family HTH domain